MCKEWHGTTVKYYRKQQRFLLDRIEQLYFPAFSLSPIHFYLLYRDLNKCRLTKQPQASHNHNRSRINQSQVQSQSHNRCRNNNNNNNNNHLHPHNNNNNNNWRR